VKITDNYLEEKVIKLYLDLEAKGDGSDTSAQDKEKIDMLAILRYFLDVPKSMTISIAELWKFINSHMLGVWCTFDDVLVGKYSKLVDQNNKIPDFQRYIHSSEEK